MATLAVIEADDLLFDNQCIVRALILALLPPIWEFNFIKEITRPKGQDIKSTIYPLFKEFYEKYTSSSEDQIYSSNILSSHLYKQYIYPSNNLVKHFLKFYDIDLPNSQNSKNQILQTTLKLWLEQPKQIEFQYLLTGENSTKSNYNETNTFSLIKQPIIKINSTTSIDNSNSNLKTEKEFLSFSPCTDLSNMIKEDLLSCSLSSSPNATYEKALKIKPWIVTVPFEQENNILPYHQSSFKTHKMLTLEEAFFNFENFFQEIFRQFAFNIIKPKINALWMLNLLASRGFTIYIHSEVFSKSQLENNIMNFELNIPINYTINLSDINKFEKTVIFSRFYNLSRKEYLEKMGLKNISFAPLLDDKSKLLGDIDNINWAALDILAVKTLVCPEKVTFNEIINSPELEIWKKKSLILKDPIFINGKVIPGYGRGSNLIGIPTANVELAENNIKHLLPGIYFGWCYLGKQKLATDSSINDIYKMVMSIGYNPYFANSELSIEPYIFHKFSTPFHGSEIHLNIIGMIRCEADYPNFGHLLKAIQLDCDFTRTKLILDNTDNKN